MNTITIKEGCPNPVALGEKGENGVSAVLFDYSEWIEDFGNGAISLLVKRKGDTAAYPVVLSTADGIATWTISDTDTAVQGYGKAEYIFTIDDKVAKSAVFSFFVAHDLGPAGDPPDPYESWIDTLTALGGETLQNAQAAQAAQEAAETAQTAAETAATNAATSATNAAQSAGAARFAAESALASADSASASATSATASATAASESATQAAASAQAAEASETAAYESANTAAEEAEVARTAATQAQTSASNAYDYAAQAMEAASDAQAAEQTATASAQSASASATSATQSAENATTYATTAQEAADEAATAVSTIAQYAEEAETSAATATQSASEAANSAEQAEASAQEAATEAAKLNNYLPTDTASGAIASFSDGADSVPVEALSVALEPIQSGSGTPSPDNIRPITGHESVEVWRAGANLIPYPYRNSSGTANGVTWTVNSDGGVTVSGTAIAGAAYFWLFGNNTTPIPLWMQTGKTYTISGGFTNCNVQVIFYGKTNLAFTATLGQSVTFTAPDVTQYNAFSMVLQVPNGTTVSGTAYPMVELGTTATTYEPYTAQHITISLGNTVYGGTIDVVGSKVVMDRVFKEYDGTENWSVVDSKDYVVLWNQPASVSNTDTTQIANWLVGGGQSYADFGKYRAQTNGAVVVGNIINLSSGLYKWETTAEFKAYVAENPLQVCYKLAEPIEIQLTANQITTLLGQNNIWSDSGDVSVEYMADIQRYISKVISEALA